MALRKQRSGRRFASGTSDGRSRWTRSPNQFYVLDATNIAAGGVRANSALAATASRAAISSGQIDRRKIRHDPFGANRTENVPNGDLVRRLPVVILNSRRMDGQIKLRGSASSLAN